MPDVHLADRSSEVDPGSNPPAKRLTIAAAEMRVFHEQSALLNGSAQLRGIFPVPVTLGVSFLSLGDLIAEARTVGPDWNG